jgi:ATP-dependent DNA helicase RecQ
LLKGRTAREIRHWIEQLVGLGHLQVAEGQYPTLALTASGLEVMKGSAPVTLFALPVAPKARRPSRAVAGGDAPSYDESLFQRLRALRRRLAAERHVPPYLIFGDRTLQELAAAKPTSVDRLRGIRGIGEVKARDLGPVFVAEIAAALSGP